jgi:hypothetical protein
VDIWFFLAAGGVFSAAIVIYVAFMIFLPEWVGITGKTALDNERSHRGENSATRSVNSVDDPPSST